MPPARFATRSNPAFCSSTHACAERAPERQTTTTGATAEAEIARQLQGQLADLDAQLVREQDWRQGEQRREALAPEALGVGAELAFEVGGEAQGGAIVVVAGRDAPSLGWRGWRPIWWRTSKSDSTRRTARRWWWR